MIEPDGMGTDGHGEGVGTQLQTSIHELLARRPRRRVAHDALRLSRINGVAELIMANTRMVLDPHAPAQPAPPLAELNVPARVRSLLDTLERGDAILAVSAAQDATTPDGVVDTLRGDGIAVDGARFAQTERVRPLIEDALRIRHIEELREWLRAAGDRLQALIAERGDGPEQLTLSPDLADAARRLTHEMSVSESEIALREAERQHWQASANAARAGIQIRDELTVAAVDQPLPIEPRLHLQLAQATFMLEGNTPRLRQELHAALQRRPDGPGLAYWSAHYHIMAGEFTQAAAAIAFVPTASRIRNIIQPILAGFTGTAPEKPHPSNFYTYQHIFVSETNLNMIALQLAALQTAEQVATTGVQIPQALQDAIKTAAATAAAAKAAQVAREEAITRAEEERERRRSKIPTYKQEYIQDDGEPSARQAGAAGGRAGVKTEEAIGQLMREAEDAARTLVSQQQQLLGNIRASALIGTMAMNALLLWDRANTEMRRGRYRNATARYAECQMAVLTYLVGRYPAQFKQGYSPPLDKDGVYSQLVRVTRALFQSSAVIQTHFRRRNAELTLDGLYDMDWVQPTVAPIPYRVFNSGVEFVNAMLFRPAKIEEKVDASLIAIALIFAPMGIGEAYRMLYDFDAARREYEQILNRHSQIVILSQFVEVLFVKLMIGQALLEKAENQYKAHTLDSQPIPGYQQLLAARTYLDILNLFMESEHDEYPINVEYGAQALKTQVDQLLGTIVQNPATGAPELRGVNLHPLAVTELPPGATVAPSPSPQNRQNLLILGKQIPIANIASRSGTVPGMELSPDPHEALLQFTSPTLKDTNPLVYALLSDARARLWQIEAGLNYLGYRDDYVPPWRFQFLLDRARYFAEHAKNAQRDYLNFLNNAENEEFREQGAAQTVTLEKSNIRIENARVDQARLEAEAANQSKGLADLAARNARRRSTNYAQFSNAMYVFDEDAVDVAWISAIFGTVSGGVSGSAGGPGGIIFGGVTGIVSGLIGVHNADQKVAIGIEQRNQEQENLRLAAIESDAASAVAAAHLEVAKQGLIVGTMQRAAALLRHEFAVQNLTFLRERTLSAELWYRLAQMIRNVSQTYLRYAIELAFMAEQAYEFESDKQINVIRFDYDASETAGLLAGDFLLRDLDTLEQDLITSQRIRQQQIRYVVSLARDFPSTLQDLRQIGSTIFSLSLRQLEQRFPGLYNIRVGAIDILPIALMDPTRFSIELTYTGTSQIRRQGPAATAPGTTTASWLPAIDVEWPVKIQLLGADTVVFSGLTRADAQGVFPFMMTNQRNAFEGVGAAASWHIDMSLRENQIDPRTLSDVLITFSLSGYYDAQLRAAIEGAPQPPTVLTRYMSARQLFPDAFYDFQQSGIMTWPITRNLLSLAAAGETLRNVGVILVPSSQPEQFRQAMASYRVTFTIDAVGSLQVNSDIPQITFVLNQLILDAQVTGLSAGSSALWDFGDGAGWQIGAQQQYTYLQPGQYAVILRVITSSNRLAEYRTRVTVSEQYTVSPPLTVYPILAAIAGAPAGQTRVRITTPAPAGTVDLVGRIEGLQGAIRGATLLEFDLARNRTYTLLVSMIRPLAGRFYGQQRYLPNQVATLNGLRTLTNREFDNAGNEINTGNRNALATQLFAAGPLSALDSWTLGLPIAGNPFLQTVSRGDDPEINLAEIDDAVLVLEYETTD